MTVGSGTAVNKNPGESVIASDNVTVKALWKETTTPPAPGKVNVIFNANGGSGTMAPKQVEKDSEYTLPVCGFTAPAGKEFDKWKVVVGSGVEVEKKPGESVIASDNITVTAIWKESAAPPTPETKVKVTFNANGGTGTMDALEVKKNSEYALPECAFTAPVGKEFDKWSVTVGTAQAVEKLPNEKVVASDNVAVKAMWRNAPAPGKVNIL